MIKFKHFPVITDTAPSFESAVNNWLQEQKEINIIQTAPFQNGSLGIFYEDPKSFVKTVREKSTGR